MDTHPDKADLLARADEAWRQLSVLLAQFSDEDLARMSTGHRWSPRDVVVHLAAWEREGVRVIDALVEGRPIQDYDDFESWNERFYQAAEGLSPAQARAELAASYQALRDRLDSLPAAAYTEQVASWATISDHFFDHLQDFGGSRV